MLLLALLFLETIAYGQFGSKTTITNPGVAFAQFADMDGDGLDDAVLALSARQSIGWHKNLGVDYNGYIRWGTFKQIYTGYSTSNPITSLKTHDVDRDGRPDIIYGVRYEGVFWVSMKTPTGSGQVPTRLTTNIQNPRKILVGDVNGDTIADLVVADADSVGRIYYIRGTYSHPYLQPYSETTIVTNGGAEIQLVHIDNDSYLDLVVTSRASMKFYLNRLSGRFDLQRSIDVWPDTRVLAFDFDRDGKNEYLAVRQDAPSGIMIGSYPNFDTRAKFPGLQFSSMALLNQLKGDFVAATPSGLWWFENNDRGYSFKQHFIGSVASPSSDGAQVFCANMSGTKAQNYLDVGFISNQELDSFYHRPDPVPQPPSTYVPPSPGVIILPGTNTPPTSRVSSPAQWTFVVVGVVVGLLFIFAVIGYIVKQRKQQAQANNIALDTVVTSTSSAPAPAYDPSQTIQPSLIYTGATVPVNAGYGAPPGYFGGPVYAAPPAYSVAEGGWVATTHFGGQHYPFPPQNNVYI